MQADVERNRLVDRIFAFDVAGRVGIPVNERTATFVETRGFLAKSIEMFVKAEFLGSGDKHPRLWIEHHAREVPAGVVRHRALVGVDELMSASVAEFDQ